MTTYSGNRQAVSLPLRPVIVFLPAFENQGYRHSWVFDRNFCTVLNHFLGGAASFGGSRLMREDLVVVTVEYRFLPISTYALKFLFEYFQNWNPWVSI